MNRNDVLALAARVEAATGADIHMDVMIWRACELKGDIDYYTASLDAAMSLVPSGFILRNYQASRFVQHSCEVALSWAHGGWIGNSDHSFALALTAAALRARAAQEQ